MLFFVHKTCAKLEYLGCLKNPSITSNLKVEIFQRPTGILEVPEKRKNIKKKKMIENEFSKTSAYRYKTSYRRLSWNIL
jgi:hypothetical protein